MIGCGRGGAVMSRDRQAVRWIEPNAPSLDGSSPHPGATGNSQAFQCPDNWPKCKESPVRDGTNTEPPRILV